MRVHLDCYPCFLRQAIIAARLGTKDNEKREYVLKKIAAAIGEVDTSKTPAHTTTFLHREIRNLMGRDPFKDIKSEYNQIALTLYPFLKNALRRAAILYGRHQDLQLPAMLLTLAYSLLWTSKGQQRGH